MLCRMFITASAPSIVVVPSGELDEGILYQVVVILLDKVLSNVIGQVYISHYEVFVQVVDEQKTRTARICSVSRLRSHLKSSLAFSGFGSSPFLSPYTTYTTYRWEIIDWALRPRHQDLQLPI